ncbi:MAG: hypothetical protein J6V92_08615, partial [Bacteroidaceae bacterium]|nr:hypothetical protein [Bacteroidaceae bacterium]
MCINNVSVAVAGHVERKAICLHGSLSIPQTTTTKQKTRSFIVEIECAVFVDEVALDSRQLLQYPVVEMENKIVAIPDMIEVHPDIHQVVCGREIHGKPMVLHWFWRQFRRRSTSAVVHYTTGHSLTHKNLEERITELAGLVAIGTIIHRDAVAMPCPDIDGTMGRLLTVNAAEDDSILCSFVCHSETFFLNVGPFRHVLENLRLRPVRLPVP